MRWLGYAWDAAAWFFLLSVASAGLIQLVRKCRARGRRKFRDEPLARVLALRPNANHEHEMDAL
jgi:hypothetical protein